MPAKLTVIVPTRNEAGNVELLYERLVATLDGLDWAVLFVDDDSPDGTWDVVAELRENHGNVFLLHRVGRRGLSSACIEGMAETASPFIAVMDADLQHDETLLPGMLERLESEDLDAVIASRFAAEADLGPFSKARRWMSRLGNRIGRWIGRAPLGDPMSGMFVIRRSLFEEAAPRLSGKGYKILLDLFASAERPLRFAEVPLRFGVRHSGQSKLDFRVVLEFGAFVLDKLTGRRLPMAPITAAFVAVSELALHLGVLTAAHLGLGYGFLPAQLLAAVTAAAAHRWIADRCLYRDERRNSLGDLAIFVALALPGLLGNMALSVRVFEAGLAWPLAGLAGALIGALWNGGFSHVLAKHRPEAA